MKPTIEPGPHTRRDPSTPTALTDGGGSLTAFFPKMATSFVPGYVLLCSCFTMVLEVVQVRLMVPESKGRTLEQIERDPGVS